MTQTTNETSVLTQALETFLASDDYDTALEKATKAAWGGSSYWVELFPDGHFRLLWSNEIGNLYQTQGLLVSVPTLDDEDYQECLDNDMEESEWFELACALERDDIAQQLRDEVKETLARWKEDAKEIEARLMLRDSE